MEKKKTACKQLCSLLAALCLLAIMLVACAPPESTVTPPPEPPEPLPTPVPVDESLAAWRLSADIPTLAALVGGEASLELRLSNIGLDVGPYRFETDAAWLNIDPESGRLEPGETDTVRLSAECSNVGRDEASLTVLGGTTLTTTVVRDCAERPEAKLVLARQELSLEAYVGRSVSEQLTLMNTGTAPLEISFDVSTVDWLTLATTSATLAPAESQVISLALICPDNPGDYGTDLALSTNDPANTEQMITVRLSCNAPPDIAIATDAIGLALVEDAPGDVLLPLVNQGQGDLSYTTETAASWLRVRPASGTVQADTSLELTLEFSCPVVAEPDEVDRYTTDLFVRSNDPDKPTLIVPINLACSSADAPVLEILEPNPLELTGTVNEQSFGRIAFRNTGGSPLEFSLSANRAWVDDIDGSLRSLAADSERTDLIGVSCGAEARVRNAVLTLSSNDPVRPEQTIPLRLTCGMPPQRSLQISLSGGGQGQVSTVPAGIDCGDTCQASFARGTEIQLRAEPLEGSSFTGWASGPCVGRQDECSFVLDDDLTIDASFSEAPAEGYSIVLRFSDSNLSPTQRAVFERAAARWAEVIRSDLPDFNVNLADNACWQGVPSFTGTVDDLVIDVTAPTIDGVGQRLGSAGPCRTRPADGDGGGLPYFGAMQLDKADIDRLEANGRLEDLILHEMGHVLGIGTLWQPFDLITFGGASCQDSSGIEYTGEAGVEAYASYGAGGFPPIDDSGPVGTKCAHWDEGRFGNELMTGYLNDVANPISRLSIATLEDMGYSVNYDAADSYELPVLGRQSFGEPLREILITPPQP